MTTALALPDVQPSPEEVVAIGFLATFRGHTRDLYGINLRQWFEWCRERGMKPLDARRAHIEIWARDLEEGPRHLKLSTIASKLNTIGGFYRYARMEGFIEVNPAEYVKRPAVPRISTTLALSRRELEDVWEAAKGSAHSADVLVVGLLAFLGLRVGEACALSLEEITESNGYLMLMVRREKGNRPGRVPVPMPMMAAIQRLLKYERTGPVLRMHGGVRMDRRAASRVVTRLCLQVGITKRITPHSLRHTFVTMAADAGVNPRVIQHSMGYADLRMVSYYDRYADNPATHATHAVTSHIEC